MSEIMDKIIAFVKKRASFFSALLAAILVGLLVWFAVFGEHADAMEKLLEVVTALALVGGGVVVWLVPQYKGEIGSFLRRIRRRFHRAAGREFAEAQHNSGAAGHAGDGVELDDAAAAKRWRRAAEQGDVRAQVNLGAIYSNGDGVEQDDVEAMKWFRRAAEQGEYQAQFVLGVAHHEGKGVARDYAEAAKWYRRAAEQGFAKAQHNLGVAYGKGLGVPQDYWEAAKWICRAAEQGLPETKAGLERLRKGE